jgi:UDP-N-acetylmuramate dehydrogenase
VRDRSKLDFSYRALAMESGWVIAGVQLRVFRESSEAIAGRIAEYLKRRKATQPIQYPSAGSVFKNPPSDYAGRLIEKAGLKGRRVGGAMISLDHANYIVNTGNAKAADILALLELAREEVRTTTGVLLEPEIRVVGR